MLKLFRILFLALIMLQSIWLKAQNIDAKYSKDPQFFKYKIGKLQVTAIYDGYNVMSRKNYVVNADAISVDKALNQMTFPKDSIVLPFTATVIRKGKKIIVFDTGLGEAMYEQTHGKLGRFLNNFKKAGFNANNVDYVIISHFHADHLGGLLDKNDQPAFPKAKVFVAQDEYDFWMNPANSSDSDNAVIKGNFARAQKIFKIIQPVKFAQDEEFLPGIKSINTHGHTPGHTSFLVSSDKQKLLLQGDLSNIPILFVEHPQWHVWSDMDKIKAERQRISIYNTAIEENWFIQGFHFPFPAIGHLQKEGTGFTLIPLTNSATIK